MHLIYSFAPALCSGVEQIASHTGPDGGLEKPPAAVSLPELRERGEIMFSGATGAAVGSGRGQATAETAPILRMQLSHNVGCA